MASEAEPPASSDQAASPKRGSETSASSLVVKRGRGRPKKDVDEKSTKESGEAASSADSSVVKRGRGRPRKEASANDGVSVSSKHSEANHVGKSVEARFAGGEAYFPGIVTAYDSEDGLMTIQYSNGDIETNVAEELVRSVKRGRGRPKKAQPSLTPEEIAAKAAKPKRPRGRPRKDATGAS